MVLFCFTIYNAKIQIFFDLKDTYFFHQYIFDTPSRGQSVCITLLLQLHQHQKTSRNRTPNTTIVSEQYRSMEN